MTLEALLKVMEFVNVKIVSDSRFGVISIYISDYKNLMTSSVVGCMINGIGNSIVKSIRHDDEEDDIIITIE